MCKTNSALTKELQVLISVTEADIENIMCALLEGDRWAIYTDKQAQWIEKPAGIYQDEWATHLLLTGETLKLIDKRNENTIFGMNIEDLYNGIALHVKNDHLNSFLKGVTNKVADTIIQYSLFKRLPYLV